MSGRLQTIAQRSHQFEYHQPLNNKRSKHKLAILKRYRFDKSCEALLPHASLPDDLVNAAMEVALSGCHAIVREATTQTHGPIFQQ